MLDSLLRGWGYHPVLAADGNEALRVMQDSEPPLLAILDWMMPGLDGVSVTRQLREDPVSDPTPTYIIMLTAKSDKEDIVQAFDAGADDYLTKPFHAGELRARLMVGERIVGLQRELNRRINALEDAVADGNRLRGILSTCSHCMSQHELGGSRSAFSKEPA
jgi:DNA-binding response OmpR family regulator